MKNSHLLRAAVALCAVNVLLALVSAWAISGTRSRLNDGLQQADRRTSDLATKSAAEANALKAAIAAAEKRLDAAEKEIQSLHPKSPPSAKTPQSSADPAEKSVAPPAKLNP